MSHSHGHGHAHHDEKEAGDKNLLIALFLNVTLTIAEIVGGLLSGSLSLLSDAAHNGSDAASVGISYGARRISRRRADRERTFGYNRAEIIAALINLTTLFVIALFLLWQAVDRLLHPQPVDGMLMLIVGAIAFVEDGISAYVLYKGAKESLNVRSAFIHLLGDTLATLGVIVGGLLVMFYDIYIVDPIITLLIAVYIVVHGTIEIRKAIRILMESAPEDFDFGGMVRTVERIPGVEDLHHVHLWRLDEQRIALEAHLAITEADLSELEQIKRAVKAKLKNDFGVDHSTLEMECEQCTGHERAVIPHE